jgi:hypothetical protein
MYPLHVVLEVPSSWKAITNDGTIAVSVGTEVRLVAVPVHSMGLTLVAEQAGSGREGNIQAGRILAAIGLQVSVKVFTAQSMVSAFVHSGGSWFSHS